MALKKKFLSSLVHTTDHGVPGTGILATGRGPVLTGGSTLSASGLASRPPPGASPRGRIVPGRIGGGGSPIMGPIAGRAGTGPNWTMLMGTGGTG